MRVASCIIAMPASTTRRSMDSIANSTGRLDEGATRILDSLTLGFRKTLLTGWHVLRSRSGLLASASFASRIPLSQAGEIALERDWQAAEIRA
jgi:hypothetical protein